LIKVSLVARCIKNIKCGNMGVIIMVKKLRQAV